MSSTQTEKIPHTQRPDLAGEHALGDAGQLLLFLLFLAVWIADSFFFKATTQLNDFIPLIGRIPLGMGVLILAGYMAKTSHDHVFGEINSEMVLIDQGLYRLMRHPMYLGEIFLYLGILIFSISLAAAAVWIIAILFLQYISRYEEQLMLNHFGERYTKYMRRVPMWLPRLRR